MCVVSMIMDHKFQEWKDHITTSPIPNTYILPQHYPDTTAPLISLEEIAEFKRLLERAREYDKKNNEPDCEMESKKTALKELARLLGIDLSNIL